MATLHLTRHDFVNTVEESSILVVVFASADVPGLDALSERVRALADAHPDVRFGWVDADEEVGLRKMFDLRAFPTLIVLKEGIVVFTHVGALEGVDLDAIVTRARALDIASVRAEIDRARPQ